jgi:mono/diheme cytochrome c family protein
MSFRYLRWTALLALGLHACSDTTERQITASTAARGKQLYDAHGAACHGAKLEGQPRGDRVHQEHMAGKNPHPSV